MQKKKVTTNFFSIYQSIFFIGIQRKRIIRERNVKVWVKRSKEKKRERENRPEEKEKKRMGKNGEQKTYS